MMKIVKHTQCKHITVPDIVDTIHVYPNCNEFVPEEFPKISNGDLKSLCNTFQQCSMSREFMSLTHPTKESNLCFSFWNFYGEKTQELFRLYLMSNGLQRDFFSNTQRHTRNANVTST